MTAPVDILLSFYVFRWRESQRDIVFVLWFKLSLKQKKNLRERGIWCRVHTDLVSPRTHVTTNAYKRVTMILILAYY